MHLIGSDQLGSGDNEKVIGNRMSGHVWLSEPLKVKEAFFNAGSGATAMWLPGEIFDLHGKLPDP